ncbi:MAG: HEPN domain-containing protein [Bacilli bacterium]|uniref:HEPN domain-containing protein n=1 Tax=Chryseobacterium sp. TaxID=1871047 RepID=UPI002FCB6401
MSIEITLYTKIATKKALINFLLTEGFQKTRHFLSGLNTLDMVHYYWSCYENYESSSGVEASIYKASSEEQSKYNCSEWILHTRTRSCGSYEDKQKQNDTIRNARKVFKGTFYNDWYGTNIYTNLNDYKKFSPLEKGISIITSNSIEKLNQIKHCLSGYKNEVSESIENLNLGGLKETLKTKDPSIMLYNSLMPFLVAVIEYFYGQCFANFIKYDSSARRLLVDEKLKIDIADVITILEKENSFEQTIIKSNNFNFQNLDSINKAYKKYLSIDVKSILSEEKKVSRKKMRTLTKTQEILDARHKFVHELDIDYNLTKESYLDYIATVENTILLTIKAFREKGLNIEIDYCNQQI